MAERMRDPPVTPDRATALKTGEAARDAITRSKCTLMVNRKPFAATYDGTVQYAAAECMVQVDKIIAACKRTNKKFFDTSFHYGDRNVMYPDGTPDDCTVGIPSRIERLSVLFPNYPLYSGATEANDVCQGQIGDCFFIGAVAALAASTAQHMNPIGRLICAAYPEYGLYGLVFFKNGGWEWVIVDDYIAITENRTPLYACSSEKELWPMVLEKGYAKIHRSWDTIDGGIEREALGDMTGGIETRLNFRITGPDAKFPFEQFYHMVKNPNTVMGCSVDEKVQESGARGSSGEAGAVYGLFKFHAYSVIDAAMADDGKGFVRVRNPWGGDAEWKGPFSDNSPEWKQFPKYAAVCKPEFKDDGAFWMTWDDFKKYFVDVDVCEYVDGNATVAAQFGKATYSSNSADQTFILELRELPGGNPKATFPVELSLAQEDTTIQDNHAKAKQRSYASLQMTIAPLSRAPNDFADLSACTNSNGTVYRTNIGYSRQVNEDVQLAPGFYSLRPKVGTAEPGSGYCIRVSSIGGTPIRMWRMDKKDETMVEVGFAVVEAPAPDAKPDPGRGGKGEVVIKPVVVETPPEEVKPVVVVPPKPTPAAAVLVFDMTGPVAPAPVAPASSAVFPADAVDSGYAEERVIRGNGPEYIYRQPRCQPKMSTFTLTNATTFCEATSSFIRPLGSRSGVAATVGYLFSQAAEECANQVRKIVNLCDKEQLPFFDKTFYYGDRRCLYPNGAPDDCTVAEPRMVKRLSELYPKYPLISNRAHANDITQGQIGDCFFIGAIAATAAAAEELGELDPIKRMFAASDPKWGVYGVVFFKNGNWEWVIVDDLIAVDPQSKLPLFANATAQELWPMLLEKAYAKIHSCWDTIDGGLTREALADLTGGDERRAKTSEFTLDSFVSYVGDPFTIIGCSVDPNATAGRGAAGRAGESSAVYGLFKGHAYSVVDAKKCSDKTGFVQVRNPWGGDAEWKGPYCDNGAEWKQNPLHFKEIKPNFGPDGCFWMKWDDFRKYFTDLEVCRWYDPKYVTLMDYGSGKQSTTRTVRAENTFILQVNANRAAQVYISLGQEDPKTDKSHLIRKRGAYASIQLSIYKLTRAPKDFNDVAKCLGGKVATTPAQVRQLDYALTMEPGLYSIVPRVDSVAMKGYYVRAFTSPRTELKLFRMDRPEKVIQTTRILDQTEASFNKVKKTLPPAPTFAPRPPGGADGIRLKFANTAQAVEEAVSLADPWNRGAIDEGLARQAFSRLLFRSDLGKTFNELLQSNNGKLDREGFKKIVSKTLQEHQS